MFFQSIVYLFVFRNVYSLENMSLQEYISIEQSIRESKKDIIPEVVTKAIAYGYGFAVRISFGPLWKNP